MSKAKQGTAFPAEKAAAWLFTFLLSAFLTMSILCALAVQMMTSTGLHLTIATGDDVVNEQIRYIHGKIDEMAEEYGFEAATVKKSVSADEIRSFNKDVATWWSLLLTQGKMKDTPSWYSSEIEESLYNATRMKNLDEDTQALSEDLTALVQNTLFPLRESLMSKGNSIIQENVDVPSLIRAVRRLPMLAITVCLFTAGVVALLLGREIRQCLKQYGTAVAGAGMAVAVFILIILYLQPADMIAEASVPFANVFRAVTARFSTAGGIAAAVAAAAGYLCLFLYNRGKKKDNDNPEIAQ